MRVRIQEVTKSWIYVVVLNDDGSTYGQMIHNLYGSSKVEVIAEIKALFQTPPARAQLDDYRILDSEIGNDIDIP